MAPITWHTKRPIPSAICVTANISEAWLLTVAFRCFHDPLKHLRLVEEHGSPLPLGAARHSSQFGRPRAKSKQPLARHLRSRVGHGNLPLPRHTELRSAVPQPRSLHVPPLTFCFQVPA